MYTFSFGGPYCPHIHTCLYQYVRLTERFMEEAVVAYLKFHPAIESDEIYKKYQARSQYGIQKISKYMQDYVINNTISLLKMPVNMQT